MKARKFNNYMPAVNETWAARVLGMELNEGNGPDLIGDGTVVEVKFTLVGSGAGAERYPRAWTVLEYQMQYGRDSGVKAYWGLGTYELDRPICLIRTKNPLKLEEIVTRREMYLVIWKWMEQYPPNETSGKTKISEWKNVLRYPKLKDLPDVTESFNVEKGKIHLTRGVFPEDFAFLKQDGVPF